MMDLCLVQGVSFGSNGQVDDMLTYSSSACLVVSNWLIAEAADPFAPIYCDL